jgi:hypothetical protein
MAACLLAIASTATCPAIIPAVRKSPRFELGGQGVKATGTVRDIPYFGTARQPELRDSLPLVRLFPVGLANHDSLLTEIGLGKKRLNTLVAT